MDSLDTEEDIKKFKEKKKSRRKGKIEKGSYGLSKPRQNSQGLRRSKAGLKQSGSILIIITQTRDNIGPISRFVPKTRAGGKSLKFYARLEIWFSVAKELKKTVRKRPRQVGVLAKLRIKKNHVTGQKGTIEVPIYNAFGIDDLGSCIDYLIYERHWKGSKNSINAKEFKFKGTKDKLIKKIEDEGSEMELRMLVSEIWKEIQEGSKVRRKKRYE